MGGVWWVANIMYQSYVKVLWTISHSSKPLLHGNAGGLLFYFSLLRVFDMKNVFSEEF